MRNKINESCGISLSGTVTLIVGDKVTSHNLLMPLTLTTALIECLRGFKNDNLPSYILIGDGGDLDPTTLVDSGARVAPTSSETSIRASLYRAPIKLTSSEKVPSTAAVNNTVVFRGVIEPTVFASTSINELALYTASNDMIAHWVSPEVSVGGRATKYTKTDLLWMSIEWAITFNINT